MNLSSRVSSTNGDLGFLETGSLLLAILYSGLQVHATSLDSKTCDLKTPLKLWHITVIPALGTWKENQEFKVIFDYIASLRPAWAAGDLVIK